MSPPAMQQKRACDICRSRKVKCNGESPCETCQKGSLSCTFFAPIRPKGPAPKRRQEDVSPKRRRLFNRPPFSTSPVVWTERPDGHYASPRYHDRIPPVDPHLSTDPLRAPPSPLSQSYPQSPSSEQNPFISRRNDTTSLALWKTPLEVPQDISPILILTLDTLIKPQLEIYFQRIYPMIPIYTHQEIFGRIDQPVFLQNEPFVSLILAMVSLSLIHPLIPSEVPFRHTRAKQAKLLMEESCRLRARWDFGMTPSVEGILTSYHMFGALFELGQAAGARLRLREAMVMGEALRLGEPQGMEGLDPMEIGRRMKLCWVLSITERAYALQRQGHLFFDGPIPQPPPGHQVDATGNHLRLLAIVFSHIDLHFVHCHNTMCEPTTCTRLSRAKVVHALKALSGSAEQVFGDVDALHSLSESQKADLLITWQWLRNRIWKIGFNHGFMTESGEEELRLEHVVEIASNCVAICQRLSLLSMEAHGTGFVEKLYDIASIVTDLVSGSGASPGAWEVIQSEKWGETLQALSDFISKHRAGIDFKGPIAGVKAFVNCVNVLLAPEAEHLGI